MSYLNKINYQYWDIKEAVETTMKERDCTEESAISFLRTDLEKMNHKTAQNWKTNWKQKIQDYYASKQLLTPVPPAPAVPQGTGASSSSSVVNNFSNHNYAESTNHFQANNYSTPQEPQRKKQRIIRKTNSNNEINEVFNPPQQQSNEQGSPDLTLPQLPIVIGDIDPEDYDRPIEEDVTVDKAEHWKNYQIKAAQQAHDGVVKVECNTQKIMALSNILLLKYHQKCHDLEEIFGIELLECLRKEIKNKFNITSHTLDEKVERQSKLIVKRYSEDGISSRRASKEVMNLTSEDCNEAVDDILLGVRYLIERILKQKFTGNIRERNLCSTYVDPVFRPILENPDAKKHFVWADVQVIDKSSKLPDLVSRELNNVSWEEPISVREVKGEDQKNDLYENLVDLIRIGLVSKDTMDGNYYDGVLGGHIVGLQVTVYLTTLLVKGLHITLEICSITLPRDVTQMRCYISNCEDLIPLHDIYQEYCKKGDVEAIKARITPGIDTPTFRALINITKNRNRNCPFVLNQ